MRQGPGLRSPKISRPPYTSIASQTHTCITCPRDTTWPDGQGDPELRDGREHPCFLLADLVRLICTHASIGVGRPLPCHALKSCAIGGMSSSIATVRYQSPGPWTSGGCPRCLWFCCYPTGRLRRAQCATRAPTPQRNGKFRLDAQLPGRLIFSLHALTLRS